MVVLGVAFIYWQAALILLGLFVAFLAIRIESTQSPEKPKGKPSYSVPAYSSTYN